MGISVLAKVSIVMVFSIKNGCGFATRAADYRVTLNSANKPTINDGSGTSIYNECALSYLGASSNATGVDGGNSATDTLNVGSTGTNNVDS